MGISGANPSISEFAATPALQYVGKRVLNRGKNNF
jgi:hypothetical protein